MDPPYPKLSPRLLLVLRLAARGKLNKEIAAELGVSAGVIKIYMHRIQIILGTRNRVESARWMMEQDLKEVIGFYENMHGGGI